MLGRQRFEGTVVFAVELDENVVPDLEDVGVVLVDEMCSISAAYPVIVNLTEYIISALSSIDA